MSKEKKIIASLAIIIIALIATGVYLWLCCQKASSAPTAKIETAPKELAKELAIDTTNIDSLKTEIRIRDGIIDFLALKKRSNVVVIKEKEKQSPPTQIVINKPPITTPPTPIQLTPTTPTAPALDPIFYEGNSRVISFCLRLGESPDRHLPHLAMLNGENFGNSRSNNQSGYNWEVPPEKVSDGLSGDYGVTRDGTFYVARSLVERYLAESDNGLVEIKTTATGWTAKKMSLVGDYYTYKR